MATEQPTWGVTVGEVHALAPHVPINDSPETNPDPVWEGDVNQAVTSAQVTKWIDQVANRASMRLYRFADLTDDNRKTIISGAVHDAVVNGATSYLVAAAYPAMAAPNEQTSYAQILWARFTDAMDEAATTLEGWLVSSASPAAGGATAGAFPAPTFLDGQQW